ncbi:hypothetical protein D3C76_909480 [compost metagenome]
MPGDLRAGQGIAPGGEKADHKQGPWPNPANDPDRRAFMPGVEQSDQAEDDRGRENTATGRVGQAHAQGTTGREREEMTDVEGDDQAGQGWQGVNQQIFDHAAGAWSRA